jgi:hypothetical protein
MRNIVFAFILAGIFSEPSHAAQADPRAVEVCKKESPTFVQVAKCLPQADVSIRTLDAFDQLYPEAAKPLKQKCLELNKDSIAAAATCVDEAVESAVKLKSSLPEGTSLDDKVFEAVSDAKLAEKFEAEQEKARDRYPGEMFGGLMYRAYR